MSLTYEPNQTEHHDLVVRVGSWANRSDTYYYSLDPGVGQDPDPTKAVGALLEGWKAAIDSCADGDPAWLPHDFADQHSGWLRCQRQGDVFQIVDGTSTVEGWAFCPSDFEEALARLDDFAVNEDFGAPVEVQREKLLSDIQDSLSSLNRSDWTP